MIVGIVCVNPEGVRVKESEMLFEMMKTKVTEYQEGSFEVLVASDFNAHIRLEAEQSSNRNERKLLDLVGVCNLHVENLLSQCSGRWTWEIKERRSVVDYILLSRG